MSEEKYPDKKIWYTSEVIPMGSDNRALLVTIQQASPNSQTMVRLQEMYRRRDDETWHYGRSGISVPILTWVNTFDPFMETEISRTIDREGLLINDVQGIDELNSIAVGSAPIPTPTKRVYHLSMYSHPHIIQAWIDWFVHAGVLMEIDKRVHLFDNRQRVYIEFVELSDGLLRVLIPYNTQGMTITVAKMHNF